MKTTRLLTLLLATALLVRADVLPPAQDTSSLKGKLTPVTGKATTLAVSATRKGYVLFNLNSLPVEVEPAGIVNARLRVYFPATKKTGDISIHTVTAAWNETTAAAEPTIAPTVVALFPAATVVAKKFVEVDVTTTVQGWRTTSATNFGFAFTASGLTSVLIGAKEGTGSGYPCELEIEIERGLGTNLTLGGTTVGAFSGNGSLLTNLNASNISNGTLSLGSNALSVGTSQLVVSDGKVGIGTSAPSTALEVVGTVTATTFVGSLQAGNVTGIVAVANGGTGTSTGSITGAGALTLAAGGANQNAALVSSGTGAAVLKPGADSAAAIRMQNAAGLDVMAIQTSNSSPQVTISGGASQAQSAFRVRNSGGVETFSVDAPAALTGVGNVLAGSGSGSALTTGISNVISGTSAGGSLQTGVGNVFIGRLSGQLVTSGNSNVFIGINAGTSNTTPNVTSSIALGAGAIATQNQQMVVGSNANTVFDSFWGSGVLDATPNSHTMHASGAPAPTSAVQA